jgi:hypothetical protein
MGGIRIYKGMERHPYGETMDNGKTLSESLEYAREAVWGKWVKWILLIVATFIFPLLYGYVLDILRGKKPAPELDHWGTLFIDGLKTLVICVIYMIPVIIVFAVSLLPALPALMTRSPRAMIMAIGSVVAGAAIAVVLALILAIFAIIAIIRFARTGKMGEAFNFGAILAHIGRIGWVSYVCSLIVLVVVLVIIAGVLSLIPIFGRALVCLLAPVIGIVKARFLTQLYDSAAPAAAP